MIVRTETIGEVLKYVKSGMGQKKINKMIEE